jgi:hypothetical protein
MTLVVGHTAGMDTPLEPPLPPQLARPRATLPDGEGWA